MMVPTNCGLTNVVPSRRMQIVCRAMAALLVIAQLPMPAQAQLFGAIERSAVRAAGRAAVRSAERGAVERAAMRRTSGTAPRDSTRRAAHSATSPCVAIPQKCAGLRREAAAQRILASKYPSERVQSETYLLNRNGRRAHDPQTGKARRVDFVLFSREGYTRRYEVTSQNADKRAQLAREQRILTQRRNGARRTGPVYVRDRATGRLVPVRPEPSKLMRFH